MKLEYKSILQGSRLFLEVDGALTNNNKTLNLKTQKFKKEYEAFRMDNPTFTEKASELMKKRKWNSTVFKDQTLLDESIYSRIINKKEDKMWQLKTIIAICVGLELHLETAEALLRSAGLCFGASKEQQAYRFLFMEFRGWPIDECNAFLESLKLTPLGSSERKSKNGL